jgi:hypothetical protein
VHSTPRFLQGVELHLAAPPGVTGTVVVDLGLVEV